jgi:hypothetical protein
MSERISGGAAEQLSSASGRPLPRTKASSRRKLVAGVGTLAVLGASAGAVWAWQALMGQGAQPAEALPASTLAYVAVDFDPAGGQKLAAMGFLKKFPSLEKQVGLTGADDLRKNVFDELKSDLGCNLGYDDLTPWMGTRFASALVQQDNPQPVLVAQVADQAKAQGGLERLARCAGGELGFALGDEWAVLAESDQVAHRVMRDAAAAPLSEDTEFQHWTGLAGDPGVATLYAAPGAGPALVAAVEEDPYGAASVPSLTGFDPLSMLVTSGLMMPVSYGYEAGGDYAMESEVSSAVRPPKPGRVHQEQLAPPPPGNEAQEVKELEMELQRLEEMTPAEQEKFFKEQDKLFRQEFGGSKAGRAPVPGSAPEGELVADRDGVVRDEAALDDEWTGTGFPAPAIPADQRAALMNFSGLGGVVRFDDGALELELVSDRIEGTMGNLVAGTAGDDVLARLPADTAAVFGAGLRDGWGAGFVQRFAEVSMPFDGKLQADAAAAFEQQTGLTAVDLEALGGDSFAVSTGAGFDPDDIFFAPGGAKLAARVSGNADAVEATLTKVRERMPSSDRSTLQWRRVGDDVIVGANAAYLDELAASGNLAGTEPFQDAVPGAADAASVFYLNFDAGDWLAKASGASDRADVDPLAGFGYSLQDDGERERALLRLTTED